MDYHINSFAQPLYVLFYYSPQLSIWMYRIIWMNEKNRNFHQIRDKKKRAKKCFKKKKKRKTRELLIYYIKFCRKSFFWRFFPGEGPPPPSESWSWFGCSACVGKQKEREESRPTDQTRLSMHAGAELKVSFFSGNTLTFLPSCEMWLAS